MTFTDAELDRDWVPNGRRPQSTLARSFSQELVDIFRIDNSVADLDHEIDKKKQLITTQTSELEALEARIREMDERLRHRRQNTDAPPPRAGLVLLANKDVAAGVEPEADAEADASATKAKLEQQKQLLQNQFNQQQQHLNNNNNNNQPNRSGSEAEMPPTPSASEDGHS